MSRKGTFTPKFIAAMSTRAKPWKEPRFPCYGLGAWFFCWSPWDLPCSCSQLWDGLDQDTDSLTHMPAVWCWLLSGLLSSPFLRPYNNLGSVVPWGLSPGDTDLPEAPAGGFPSGKVGACSAPSTVPGRDLASGRRGGLPSSRVGRGRRVLGPQVCAALSMGTPMPAAAAPSCPGAAAARTPEREGPAAGTVGRSSRRHSPRAAPRTPDREAARTLGLSKEGREGTGSAGAGPWGPRAA